MITSWFLVYHSCELGISTCIKQSMWRNRNAPNNDEERNVSWISQRCYKCCPPYYRTVYDDILDEEVSCYLNNELRKIAKAKAEKLCEIHLTTVRNYELPNNGTNPNDNHNDIVIEGKVNADENSEGNGGGNAVNHGANDIPNDDEIYDAWQNISHSYFYLKE